VIYVHKWLLGWVHFIYKCFKRFYSQSQNAIFYFASQPEALELGHAFQMYIFCNHYSCDQINSSVVTQDAVTSHDLQFFHSKA